MHLTYIISFNPPGNPEIGINDCLLHMKKLRFSEVELVQGYRTGAW